MTDDKRRQAAHDLLAAAKVDEAAGRPVSRPAEDTGPPKARPPWAVTAGGLVKFTAYFTEAELAKIEATAEAEGISAAAVVRRAVRRDLGR